MSGPKEVNYDGSVVKAKGFYKSHFVDGLLSLMQNDRGIVKIGFYEEALPEPDSDSEKLIAVPAVQLVMHKETARMLCSAIAQALHQEENPTSKNNADS